MHSCTIARRPWTGERVQEEDDMLALTKIKSLAQQEFAAFGLSQMAYVKRVATNSGDRYAIHAADGRYLHEFPSREVASAALRQHDLEPMSLH